MATRITDLPQLDGTYNLDDLLIIYNTIQEKTSTIPASVFRGRGVYSNSSYPDPAVHVNPEQSAYVLGDLFYYTPDARVEVYQFNGTTFDFITQIRQPAKYAETRLPPSAPIFATIKSSTTYVDDNFFVTGDTLEDTVLGVTFGPYAGAQYASGVETAGALGFDFRPESRLYSVDRSASTFYGTVEPTAGNSPVAYAKTNDRYEYTDGTKVWLYTYDEADEMGASWNDMQAAGWGNKVSIDQAQIHNGVTVPLQDDTAFTTGDIYMYQAVDGTRRIYGPYTESAVDDDAAWARSTFTSMNGSRTHVIAGIPPQDDTLYSPGDLIVSTIGEVRFMYGPYIASAIDADASWDSANRVTLTGSHIHSQLDNTFPVGDDTVFTGGDYIAVTIRTSVYMYGPYVYGQDLVANGGTHADQSALDLARFNSDNPVKVSGSEMHSSTGAPVVNDTLYDVGDMCIAVVDNRTFMYGPYVLDATDAIAWAYASRIQLESDMIYATATELAVDNSLYKDGDYQLVDNTTTLEHYLLGPYSMVGSTWGTRTNIRAPRSFPLVLADMPLSYAQPFGGTFVQGDTLHHVLSATRTTIYGPHDGTVNGLFSNVTSELHPANWYRELTDLQAVRDDTKYRPGDMIMNDDGIIYGPYVELQGTDMLAWPNPVNVPAIVAGQNPMVTKDGTSDKFEIKIDANNTLYFEQVV